MVLGAEFFIHAFLGRRVIPYRHTIDHVISLLSLSTTASTTMTASHPAQNGSADASHARQFGTLAVHAGAPHDPTTGAVIAPVRSNCLWLQLVIWTCRLTSSQISLSTTFAQTSVGKPIGSYEYTRSSNPNR